MPGREVREPGPILREARLHKGLSLMEAQQATKIRQSFLAALEEDDYTILPPPVYVRGFIKNYATYLGLEGQEMVLLFDELLESVAAGYEPYHESYGSTDSGGAGIPAAINPQLLVGLSQGEARMVERGSEMINLTPHDRPAPVSRSDDEDISSEEKIEVKPKPLKAVGYGSADSSGMFRRSGRFAGLRVPEKYVLKPAIQPINKPSFYMPNFVPLVLVLIIVGAAFLIAYRGLAVPPVKDLSEAPTVTPNVYSRPTVTPLSTAEFGKGQVGPGSAATNGPDKPPAFYTPDQALVAPNAPGKGTPTVAAALPAALTSTTLTPTPTVAITDSVKVEITASGGPSWLSVLVDGQEKYGKILPAGETVNYEGKLIAVRAGAPGVIKVKVNGQDKQYSPPASGIITHTWGANGDDKVTS